MKIKLNPRVISLALSLLGVGGVGVTSWLSVKCHEKAKEKTEKKDKMICYIPAVASGVATAGCILGSHHVSSKEIAYLTASCGYLAANRDKIKKKLEQVVGTDEAKKIETEAVIETKQEAKQNKMPDILVEDTGYGRIHFIDEMFGREFYCSLEHVEWAEKMLNHMYMQGERVNYNTFYELLGLKKTRAGWENGWPMSEDIYGYSVDQPIYFDNRPVMIDDNERGYVIDVRTTPPLAGYLEMED